MTKSWIASLTALACAALATTSSCGTPAPRGNPLLLSQPAQPDLRRRLASSPHAFFRAINTEFSLEVCRQLDAGGLRFPIVPLHGDAHIEQFAVTDEGIGLGDFDAAARGSAALDLLRFSTSLVLAVHGTANEDSGPWLAKQFMSSYQSALAGAGGRPTPRIASVIRKARPDVHREERIAQRLSPVSAEADRRIRASFGQYATTEAAKDRRLPAGFFSVVAIGALHGGVGSAGTARFLVRVQGATSLPSDDEFIELKPVARDVLPSCKTAQRDKAAQVLESEGALIETPRRFIASLRLDGKRYWAHAWPRDYWELDLRSEHITLSDISEVAQFVGAELGKAHRRSLKGDARAEGAIGVRSKRLLPLCIELAKLSVEAWRQFRAVQASKSLDG